MTKECVECGGKMEPQQEVNGGKTFVWEVCEDCGYSSGVLQLMSAEEFAELMNVDKGSNNMEQYRLEFKAENGYVSACNITIYRDIQLIVATEIDEGQSVTNACEVIATEVVKRYGVDPERMMFIEHYPAEQRPTFGESYDLVTFRWDGKCFWNPDWRHLPPAEFHDILNTVNNL